jgi:integrase
MGDRRATVADFLEHWVTTVLPATARSTNTVDNYTWAVRQHLVPSLGKVRLTALTPDDVDNMLKAKAAQGLSHSSLMRLRAVLVKALRHAERPGKVARNVAALVDSPKGKGSEVEHSPRIKRERCSLPRAATGWKLFTSPGLWPVCAPASCSA